MEDVQIRIEIIIGDEIVLESENTSIEGAMFDLESVAREYPDA